ncbi:MAG TPA: SiaC family regulatory phosphoprotein, partial [Bacteroidales bacterium]|nr:SiaC family regulatory phosphoprotein [Bacteroidales bacterium]
MKNRAVLVEGTKTLPAAYFEEGRLVIRGRSIELNQQDWWNRLVQQLNILQIASRNIRELHIQLEYLNSETNRILMHMFSLVDKINYDEGGEIKIKWHCSAEDEIMLEQISIFSSIID